MSEVAFIHPYWDFWASTVPGDFRTDRLALLGRAVAALGPEFSGSLQAIAGTEAEAAGLANQCGDVDVVVIVSTMAVPPATTMALIERLDGLPVVVWALHAEGSLPDDFSHTDITTRGATVGAPMIVSALVRADRPHDAVMTTLADVTPALEAIRCARAAKKLRGATVLGIGAAMPGYTSVVASERELAPLQMRIVTVGPEELAERAMAVSSGDTRERMSVMQEAFEFDDTVSSLSVERNIRIELALGELVKESGASAGALNCHVPSLRFNSDIGVCPCMALGELTTRGTPWTCSGDIVTAVAMLSVQALGFPTLYHEIEAVDYVKDEVILANTGEHDRRLAGPGRIRVSQDAWFTEDGIPSPCAQFSLAASPASLVSFVPVGGLRWIVADGDFTGSAYPRTGTPNGGFRFASGHVTQAWPKWMSAGAVHHSAATNERVTGLFHRLAGHLGGEVVAV